MEVPAQNHSQITQSLYEALCRAELIMAPEDFDKLQARAAMRDYETLAGYSTKEELVARAKKFMDEHQNLFKNLD